MSVKKVQKKLIISLLILSVFLTGNCFGKFSLVRKIYDINSDITFGQQGKMGGLIKSIFMIIFLFLPVYGISAFVDIILFNLIEFWTDKNPLAINEKANEELVSNNGTSITKKINGNRMDLVVKNNEKIETIGTALPFENTFSKDTLFLRGDKSDYILDSDFETIYHHFPSACIKTLKNSGHWLQAENPKDFFSTVLDFIK
jgi:hypothetical protein